MYFWLVDGRVVMVERLMTTKPTKRNDATALLQEAKKLAAEERQIERRKRALAQKLIEAGQALGGTIATESPAPRRKRKRRKAFQTMVGFAKKPKDAPARTRKPTSWPKVIYDIVHKSPDGVWYGEIKTAVAKTHLGATLERTDKAFYGALGKLDKAGFIVRHNGRAFTKKAYARFRKAVEEGRLTDEPVTPHSGQRSPARDAISQYLQTHPAGAPIAELFTMLERDAGIQFEGKNSKTIVYNLIARLIKRGHLTKDTKGIIRVSRVSVDADNDEAPHVLTRGASH
jgi:hypothetical protein